MEIKTYIEMGEKRAGKQVELAKILGVRDSYLRTVKTGRNGLPDAVCILLARYIEVDPLEVIAASNLVTEKDEERRKIFESCFTKAASVAAAAIVISILTLPLQKPVNAQEISSNLPLYKLLAIDRRRKGRRKSDFMTDFFGRFLSVFRRDDLSVH